MNYFGMNLQESDAVPPNKIYALPPWIGECRIIAGVAVRFRGKETKGGETRNIFSPLTEDELKQIAVLNFGE